MLIGGARVSNDNQMLDLLRDALWDVGCEPNLEHHASGAGEHPGLRNASPNLPAGDSLVDWRLDRLRRTFKDPTAHAKPLRTRGVGQPILE